MFVGEADISGDHVHIVKNWSFAYGFGLREMIQTKGNELIISWKGRVSKTPVPWII